MSHMNTKKVHITDYCPKCGKVLDSRHDPKCDGRKGIQPDTDGYPGTDSLEDEDAPLVSELDFAQLGTELRQSADDAFPGEVTPLGDAWSFLLCNPECFEYDEWPADMPQTPPEAAIDAYYRADRGARGIC